MIPILFEKDTTTFQTQGLGRLPDCISCTVTEERNGLYECQFQYPITGRMYPELQIGRIIVCTHDDRKDFQPFIIYARSIPDVRGIVTFNAYHISYKLNDIVVMPYTASNIGQALQRIKTYSANANPFTFWTDKNTVANFKSEVPRAGRNMLGGEENSILDVYGGGEYEFDNFTVKLYAQRGRDSGVSIRYGKNLIDLKQDIDGSSCYNAVAPFWADSEGNVATLPEKLLFFGQTGETVDATPMDLSQDFDTKPTAAQMRAKATSRYQSGKSWMPSENITVDFVQLWQTEEYKNFTGLQRVSLCDMVSVYYEPAGVEAVKQKVVRTVYNVLLERYDQIELGELQTSLGQAIQNEILEIVPTTSIMEQAIQYATELIRGGLGGYVVMTPGENGYPQEILIMDTPDVNTAVNVWRFNMGGLGHSHSGYNGPYNDIALTQDGRINATMITTGILNANIIKAGVLSDYNENTVFNLSTGAFSMKKGSINLGSGNFVVTDAGVMTIKRGSINLGDGNFTVNDSGTVAIKSGSINLGSGNFVVTSAGVMTIKRGSIDLGNGNFTVNDSGVVAIKTGSINLGSGNFVVTDAGVMTIKRGSINLGSGNFTVDDSGSLKAISGTIGPYTLNSSGLSYSDSYDYLSLSATEFVNTHRINWAAGGSSVFGTKISSGDIVFVGKKGETNPKTYYDVFKLDMSQWASGSGTSTIFLSLQDANNNNMLIVDNTSASWPFSFYYNVSCDRNFSVSGTKSRRVETKSYSDRLLYSYETPTPIFGDIGQAVLDEEGLCYVAIDDIFTETIARKAEYQVFLQAEGEGSCWIAEKSSGYFVIAGTPHMRVAWELKAKQRDYENIRLEMSDNGLEEYADITNPLPNMEEYIKEQEALLYGYN